MDKNLQAVLLTTLEDRFNKHMERHIGLNWNSIHVRLYKSPEKLKVLAEMERSGGEPDVIDHNGVTDEYTFCDCSPESPLGRRSLCYDRKALDARKKNKPGGSAMEMAATMGVDILTEKQYRELQALGEFDRKTSSWVITPSKIRDLGGAIFCDRRYDQVFVYHNGADSYYAARGFRGCLKV